MILTHNIIMTMHYSKIWDLAQIKLCLGKQAAISALYRRNLYCQTNYHSEIEEVVNTQIQAEQQASQNYLNMAVAFLHPSKSLVGAGGFFMKMYKEELGHMQKLIHYQLLRGGTPLLCGLEPPIQNKNLTLLDAFKQGLSMEKNITKHLEEAIKLAEEVKDYHYEDFITSVFLAEQMQSIHEMATHVTKLTAVANNAHAIYQYDLELGKMYPYSYKVQSTVR